METIAWVLLLMAVAIIAGYFYIRRRRAHIDRPTEG